MEKETKMPTWSKWLLFIMAVAIIGMIAFWRYKTRNERLDKAKDERKEIVAEIDSTKAVRAKTTTDAKAILPTLAEKSKQRTKTIENEKLYFVGDADYDAMCRFITDFKPTDGQPAVEP